MAEVDDPALEDDDESADANAPKAREDDEHVPLIPGAALRADETLTITVDQPVQLIVLAGQEGSGKTTIVASLYEKFCCGPFAGMQFAGSRSLLGFEAICHLNRLASGGSKPTTERTSAAEDPTYYHLQLVSEASSGSRSRHLLLSAVSGERFRFARDSREDCQALTFVRRADVLIVLIDGDRLLQPDKRENAITDGAGILDSLIDDSVLHPRTCVEIVFSKYDRIAAAGKTAAEFVDRAQKRIATLFDGRVRSLAFRRLAARPDGNPKLDASTTLSSAFEAWLSAAPQAMPAADLQQSKLESADDREFTKFGWRYALRSGSSL